MREASSAWNDRFGAPRAWGLRVLLGAVALGGSALYAASFQESLDVARLAGLVALGAGVSWLVFGAALLALTRARPSVLEWADACLVTMAVGIGALLLSVLLNVGGRGSASAHVGVIALSNVSMAAVFVARARRLGLGPGPALALWVLALDAPFLVFLAVMA